MQARNLHPKHYEILQGWAGRLQRWRVHQLAAVLLEAFGPLNVVGAQLVYLSQPVLGSIVAQEKLYTLAEWLEEPIKTKKFYRTLGEDGQ
ncbi:MAG: hypothetical protein P8046_11195 [Anaerolineales bacterium]